MAEWEHMDGVSRGNFTVHSKWEAQPGSKPGVTFVGVFTRQQFSVD